MLGHNIRLLEFLKNLILEFNSDLCNNIYSLSFKHNLNKNSSRLVNSLEYYFKVNYLKLKKIKNNDYYLHSENMIIIVDIRPSKPRIFVINKNKCFLSLTSGIIYKKLAMKQKKTKKTEKMLNLMLKSVFLNLQRRSFFKKCIIHLKGTRSNLFNVLVLINNNFKSKKLFLIYSPHIGFNKFKFKKIKSIKRRLRKRFSKLIKN